MLEDHRGLNQGRKVDSERKSVKQGKKLAAGEKNCRPYYLDFMSSTKHFQGE